MFGKQKDKYGKFIKVQNLNDIVGKKINNWKVLSFEGYDKSKKLYYYWCKCECGSIHKKHRQSLTKCTTNSCKTCKYIVLKMNNNNVSGTITYNSWRSLRYRCDNPNRPEWKHYGGLGISYCNRWKSYSNFFEDMGERPPGTTIDRINTNGNYEPSNCRWATSKQQTRNSNKNSYYNFRDKSLTIIEWSELTGIKYSTLVAFLNKDNARTINDALKYFNMSENDKDDFVYNGKYFHLVDGIHRSYPWIAKSLNVIPSIFLSMTKKLSIEETIKYYKLSKAERKIFNLRRIYGTHKYKNEDKTLKEWCEYLVADRHSFYRAIDDFGFDKAMEIYDISDESLSREDIKRLRIIRVKNLRR